MKKLHELNSQELMSVANRLANKPTKSTEHMAHEERRDGIFTMLDDLIKLAVGDGCVAAGWALELIQENLHTLSRRPYSAADEAYDNSTN